ncbi:MAG: outer membrane protein transport protein [Cyclobacteriaceae bacterium]
MKIMKWILIATPLILLQGHQLMAQSQYGETLYYEDALRFSQHPNTGSARISGLGGTQNALGGDISNIHGNPAGLGFFQKSEFSFTAAYTDWNAHTQFLNQPTDHHTTNFSLPNLGAIFSRAKAPLEVGDWRGGAFGISINRQSSYNHQYGYVANSPNEGSVLNFYADLFEAVGVEGAIPTEALYFDAFLINPSNNGYNISPNATGQLVINESVENEGNMTQVSFSYGGNFKNKFFLGASLGINTLTSRSTKTYEETFSNSSGSNPNLFSSLQQNLFLDGSGINLGLGVIYKPLDELNLGLNFKSPSWIRVNDEYDADIIADFNPPYQDPVEGTIPDSNVETDVFVGSYTLRTPMKIGAGLTYFFEKKGFITADANYLDYSTAHLRSNSFNPSQDNADIDASYGKTINYSVGGELRHKIFRLRAGYAYYGDPFRDSSNLDRSSTQITGGLGVKLSGFSLDFGLVSNNFNSKQFALNDPSPNPAITENQLISGMVTLGFSF